MIKTLTLQLLRDPWMIHEPYLELYSQYAQDVLAGKEIPQGLFGTLKLPEVPENIALVTMSGVLMKADSCGAEGARSLSLQIADASRKSSIDGIILLAENCPGGQAQAPQEMVHAINAAKTKMPVVGAISGLCASANYWPMAACDEAYAQTETDIIGCIGVVAKMRNPKKLDAENEDIIQVYSDLSPDKNIEDRDIDAYKKQIINPLAEVFHDGVKAGRGSRLKLNKENVLSGKTYLAGPAAEYGLIDGVMPMNKIIARVNFLARQKNRKK